MMPQFILICHDQPESFALRAETRAQHLQYIKGADHKVLLAGPILDQEGRPIGSVLIIEADDLNAAQAFAENDPYSKAELFLKTEIRAYKVVMASL